LEAIKLFIFIVFIISNTYCQKYDINILGIHAANVIQEKADSGSIRYTTQNRGIFDLMWPANNSYLTKYDPLNYSLISYEKRIKQGDNNAVVLGELDTNNYFLYDRKNKIKVPENIKNIFTLLAIAQEKDKDIIDGLWYNYEHEGMIGRARFLFADSTNIWYKNDSILCDHYRFDISINDSSQSIKIPDYFMKNIVLKNAVRELWISRENPKKIIKAKVGMGFFSVNAIIRE
tara:strand:- start:311 stop:1006 length:696 start_codon:yes stop_codon:yes gene_type:complete